MDSPTVPGAAPRETGVGLPAGEEPRPIGLAFLLGVIVGGTAAALLHSDEPREERARPKIYRRLIRRPDPPPRTLGEIVRREAVYVAESVVKDVGKAVTRWVLDATAPGSPPVEYAREEPDARGGVGGPS